MADGKETPDGKLDPRVYFAAERTLLAWVRTGLAMMGFGFVVARFGLFLRELAAVPGVISPRQHVGLSLWLGTTLVCLGVVVTFAAGVRHWRSLQRLERGQPLPSNPLSLALGVAFLLGLLGLVMATYLLLGLGQAGQ
jgi:putative membrane protein